MANYRNLTDALDAGVRNMTILRNNVKNDDGTTTYATGIDWFRFNSKTVSNIYSSGNSWLGFGANTEQLRVNRRDAAVYYEYKELGSIGDKDFFRFRWRGYSSYSNTGAAYLQEFEVFLFSTGQIYLNFKTVPTSNCNGYFTLVCGSQTVSYSVTAGLPCEYTFTPSDPVNGTGWSVTNGRPALRWYKTSGSAEFTFTNIHSVTNVDWTEITWSADTPEGTSLKVYAKLDDDTYTEMTNGGELPIPMGASLEESTLYLKAELETAARSESPALRWLHIRIRDTGDLKTLVLTIDSGNVNDLQNAVGAVTVNYDGSGGLAGYGGSVERFSESFTPSNIIPKPHQHDTEHIEITQIAGTGNLIGLVYGSVKNGDERLEIAAVSASGQRIYVGDI